MRKKTHKIVEGRWDCDYCGTKGIKGRFTKCPNCGVARGKDTEFYLPPEEEREILKGEELRTFNRNPDWLCPFCGSLNSDSNKTCVNCGSTRTEKNQTYFDLRKEEEKRRAEEEVEREYVSRSYKPEKSRTLSELFSKENICIALMYTGIVAVIAFLIYLVSPKHITLNVEGFKWERTVAIEKFQTVEESGYYLPEDARLISSTEEPDDDDDDDRWSSSDSDDDDDWGSSSDNSWSSSDNDDDNWWSSSNDSWSSSDDDDWWSSSDDSWSSSDDDDWWSSSDDSWGWDDDSETDLGNGYFDIYDMIRIPVSRFFNKLKHSITFNKTKYVYEIDKWVYDRTITAEGNDHNPYWPDTSNLSEIERESSKNEEYYVTGTDSEGKQHEIKISYSDWESIEIGDKVKFEVSFGNAKIIND